MEKHIFNRFVFNMIKGNHFQLSCDALLFCNFKWVNIKAVVAHCSVIQKEVDKPLAKSAIESSTGGTNFYSYVSVVPRHIGGL